MNNVSPILFHYNLDENGNPKSIIINDEHNQISTIHYSVQLKQRPDEEHNLVVVDNLNNTLSQVYDMEDITENTYYVDYQNALVYFHPSKAGKTFIFNYAGVGYELISCSRVYDSHDVTGQTVVRTLQDIIDAGRKCIEALSLIGDAIEVLRRLEADIVAGTDLAVRLEGDITTGEILHINLTNDIKVGTPLHNNLVKDIADGTTLKGELTTINATATTLKNDLTTKITEGNTTKANLDTANAEAKQNIAVIQSTGNGTWTIPSSAWTGTAPNLVCTINHRMGSKNLIVAVVDTITQKSIMSDYRIIDMDNIEMQSIEASNITVIINAKYYSGKDANIIAQEVQDARGVEANLKARLDKFDTLVATKVDKVEGKGLSTNDYDNIEKSEVAKIKNKADNVDADRTTVAKDVTGAINELDNKIVNIYSIIPSKRAKIYMISGRALANSNDCDDISIIIHNDGTITCIDFGKNGYYTQIKSKLDELGITKIDRAIATHSHGDHIGNAPEIIRDFRVKKLYLREKVLPQLPSYESQPPYNTPTMHSNMLNACTTYGVEVVEIGNNGKIAINNDESFTTFYLTMDTVTDYNTRSLMVLYENKYKRVLFEGDLTLGNDETVITPNLKYADIIKIGHHGLNAPSSYPSSWIKTMPSIAVLNDTYSSEQSQNNTKLKGYNIKTTTVKKNEGCCMFLIEDGIIYESNRLETVF